MHRLNTESAVRLAGVFIFLSALLLSCAQTKPVVRDQLVVEKLRLRITKVRNAVAETRAVIAASRGAAYMPELRMRLAELLSEEARYHYMVAYEREQRRTKSLHVPQVRFLKEQAIGTYREILKRYPDTHLADRILFNISHEQRELGLFSEMKQTLEKLITSYPQSPYYAEALLVLGDYHFDRTEFAKAEKYYGDIVKSGQGPLLGLAYYKLAWVHVNLSDCKNALVNFEKAIVQAESSSGTQSGSTGSGTQDRTPRVINEFEVPESRQAGHDFAGHRSLNVQREALVDLTYCYAQERKPDKAAEYLRKLAYTREAYIAALSKMANRYALIEQPRGAAEVARELLRLAPDDPERLDDARMLHTAVSRMKDYSSVGEDVRLILRAMRRRILKPDLDESESKLMENEFEMVARDLATRSHEMLMEKSAKSKWAKQAASPEDTARAYEAYLDSFPDSENRLEVIQNYADVLMDAKEYLRAGHMYRESARLLALPLPEPEKTTEKKNEEKDNKAEAQSQKKELTRKERLKLRKKERRDALYNAVVAYQKSLESEGARSHSERAGARAGLRRAGGMYLAEGKLEGEKAIKIKFAVAQSYYDEGNYLDAIDLLTAVAYEFPGTQQGNAAVHMVLDSYRTINDLNGLINVGRRFLADGSPLAKDVMSQIKPIVEAAEQRRLDELSLAASGERAGGMEVLLTFADRYKDSDLGERAMLSAFVAARAGGDISRLYELGEAVVKRFPQSQQAAGVVSTMGRTAAARFEFDRAIQYLERSARISQEQRAALLITAGELREQLADRSGAIEDYRKALKAAGEGPDRAEAVVHLADLIERGGSPEEIVKELKPLADPPDPEIASRLGLALLRTGKHYEAEDQLRLVVEGAAAASTSAQARANYGMAEIMLHMLATFEPLPELDAIEELIGLIDVVLQSYLAAARQPDPVFSQAALARLARAAEIGAEKIGQIRLPDSLSPEEKAMIMQAMSARAAQLKSDQSEALAACAQRAKASYLLDEAGRACIQGRAPAEDPVRFLPLKPRKKASKLKRMDEVRDRLSRNPDDLESLRVLGRSFLDAGDAHAARLVLGRTAEAGGGAEDLNMLGIASYRAGDLAGALDAFGRAREAGSNAAAMNLSTVCAELGLDELADEFRKNLSAPVEGQLLVGKKGSAAATKRGES